MASREMESGGKSYTSSKQCQRNATTENSRILAKTPLVSPYFPVYINFPIAKSQFSYTKKSPTLTFDSPPCFGQKPVPQGFPGSFIGLNFMITGSFLFMTKETAAKLITDCGGVIVTLGKPDILLRGSINVVKSKLESAIATKTIIIDEDGLFTVLKESWSIFGQTQKLFPTIQNFPSSPPEINEIGSSPQLFPHSSNLHSPCPLILDSPPDSEISQEFSENSPIFCEKTKIETNDDHFRSPKSLSKKSRNSPRTSNLWAEKYRPQSLKDLIGNEDVISRIVCWMETFDQQDTRVIFITGPPGVGKTSVAEIVGRIGNHKIIEVDASSNCLERRIMKMIEAAFQGQEIQGPSNSVCVIIDEMESILENEQEFQQLTHVIEQLKGPLICIWTNFPLSCSIEREIGFPSCLDVNLAKNKRKLSMQAISLVFHFGPLTNVEIIQGLQRICDEEGLLIDPFALKAIAEESHGDLRSAINSLQFWEDQSHSGPENNAYFGNSARVGNPTDFGNSPNLAGTPEQVGSPEFSSFPESSQVVPFLPSSAFQNEHNSLILEGFSRKNADAFEEIVENFVMRPISPFSNQILEEMLKRFSEKPLFSAVFVTCFAEELIDPDNPGRCAILTNLVSEGDLLEKAINPNLERTMLRKELIPACGITCSALPLLYIAKFMKESGNLTQKLFGQKYFASEVKKVIQKMEEQEQNQAELALFFKNILESKVRRTEFDAVFLQKLEKLIDEDSKIAIIPLLELEK